MIYSDNTYDITNNIATYTRRDFKSVFDTTSNKWYMLNNLNNYEEYGIYGDSFDTYYQGKLVIVNGHEYEWDGTEWDDLGEDDYQTYVYRNSSHTGYIVFPQSTSNVASIEVTFKLGQLPNQAGLGKSFLIGAGSQDENDWRIFQTGNVATSGNLFYYDCGNGRTTIENIINVKKHYRLCGSPMKLYDYDTETVIYEDLNSTRPTNASIYFGFNKRDNSSTANYGSIYDHLVFYSDNDGLTKVADYVPLVQNNVAGFYDTINDVFVGPATGTIGSETTGQRPKDYPTKSAPTISTLWASTIYRNSTHLTKLMRNDAEMAKIDYMSDDILKKGEAPIPPGPYEERPFGMKVYDGDINVQRRNNPYTDCVIYYLIDSYSDNNWTVFPVDSVGINVNSGSTIYFYGPSTNRISKDGGNSKFYISGTGKVDLIGNFLSLCNPSWTENMKLTRTLNNTSGQFINLFSGNTNIYNAKDMYIRTDEITCGDSYGIAFGYMFIGCTNLLTGPTWICKDNKLTINYVAQFIAMFNGCTNLKTVTLPPITTYSSNRHFENMLKNCTSLETIYYDGVYPINSTSNSKDFSSGMNATGDFYNLKNTTISRDANGIPSGWTVHTSL